MMRRLLQYWFCGMLVIDPELTTTDGSPLQFVHEYYGEDSVRYCLPPCELYLNSIPRNMVLLVSTTTLGSHETRKEIAENLCKSSPIVLSFVYLAQGL